MSQEQRRKITTITSSRTSTYGASSNRSAFGYWVPLAITVTAATVALGAWIWSERSDDDIESESEAERYYTSASKTSGNAQGSGLSGAAAAAGAAGLGAAAGYSSMSGNAPPGPGPTGAQPPSGSYAPQPPVQGGFQGPPPGPSGPGGEAASFYRGDTSRDVTTSQTNIQQDDSFIARMSNAVGLTRGDTSGRNNFSGGGWASTSLAAAGSVVGAAVNAVRRGVDEREQHFSDQEKWSEEADKPERVASPRKSTGSLAAAGGAALAAGAGGAALGAATKRSESSSRALVRTGTAAEFYSGEVDAPRRSSALASKRRTVAIIVSAVDNPADRQEVDAHQSMLAHLASYVDTEVTRIMVLIYDPELHTHPLSLISRRASERQNSAPSVRSQSTSSYAKINTPGANGTPLQTPGDFPQDSQNEDSDDKGILAHVDPRPLDSASLSRNNSRDGRPSLNQASADYQVGSRQNSLARPPSNELIPAANPLDMEANPLFKTLYNQANQLVDRDTSILPFTSRDGHKHILRSIQPEIVYIQEALCGVDGSLVTELQGWVRSIIVVIGDEGGMGGLVDSDTEEESTGPQKKFENTTEKWWRKESVTGVGRGVSVVESLRVGEDWQRRVNEDD